MNVLSNSILGENSGYKPIVLGVDGHSALSLSLLYSLVIIVSPKSKLIVPVNFMVIGL